MCVAFAARCFDAISIAQSAALLVHYGTGARRCTTAYLEYFAVSPYLSQKAHAASMQITASKWLSGKSSLVAFITWKVQLGARAGASAICASAERLRGLEVDHQLELGRSLP